eukprot:6320052-Prymnesium_polylepis.1
MRSTGLSEQLRRRYRAAGASVRLSRKRPQRPHGAARAGAPPATDTSAPARQTARSAARWARRAAPRPASAPTVTRSTPSASPPAPRAAPLAPQGDPPTPAPAPAPSSRGHGTQSLTGGAYRGKRGGARRPRGRRQKVRNGLDCLDTAVRPCPPLSASATPA